MNKLSVNKKAYYDYNVIDNYTAGIQLIGSEIKPIKNGNVSIKEGYCYIRNGEVLVKGMHVSPNDKSNKYDAHDPYRERKLLLNKKEIDKLNKGVESKGMTIIPLNLFITNTGLIKLTIGLCSGKKNYDKRESIKTKDIQRDLDRRFK